MGDSPTGRGYTQGSDSYSAYDAERICHEEAAFQERKRQAAILHLRDDPPCTCAGSSFGMDVDRCPLHGVGCA